MNETKYNNKEIIYNGIKFDSTMEKDYYIFLSEEIYPKDLFPDLEIVLQPKFEIQPKFTDNQGNKIRAITYTADFQVGNTVYDVKGMSTQQGEMRVKMFKHAYRNTKLILRLVTKAPKYTGLEWIELYELKSIRKQRKKV